MDVGPTNDKSLFQETSKQRAHGISAQEADCGRGHIHGRGNLGGCIGHPRAGAHFPSSRERASHLGERRRSTATRARTLRRSTATRSRTPRTSTETTDRTSRSEVAARDTAPPTGRAQSHPSGDAAEGHARPCDIVVSDDTTGGMPLQRYPLPRRPQAAPQAAGEGRKTCVTRARGGKQQDN